MVQSLSRASSPMAGNVGVEHGGQSVVVDVVDGEWPALSCAILLCLCRTEDGVAGVHGGVGNRKADIAWPMTAIGERVVPSRERVSSNDGDGDGS